MPGDQPKKDCGGSRRRRVVQRHHFAARGLIFTYGIYGGERQANWLSLLIIGFFGAFVSVLGDLSFSLIKRSCHIKDFGSVIPGHGGILDRFDSVIFTAPFVYMVTMLLPIVS